MDLQTSLYAKIGQLWLRVMELEHEVATLRAQLPPAPVPAQTLTVIDGLKKE